MKNIYRLMILVSVILVGLFTSFTGSKSQSPVEQDHKKHHDQVNERGDHVMGFSHESTTHHFRLTKDGGLIEVTANDARDDTSREQIRQHLKHIAHKFSEGDFSAPMIIHGQTPPGIDMMKQLSSDIKYEFLEIDRGATVRISTQNKTALKAIHEFLRFQIKDHQTGDPN